MKNSELTKIKKIINMIINLLEKSITNLNKENELTNRQKDLLGFLLGNKENIISVISKLSLLLIKIDSATNGSSNMKGIELEKNDVKIILDYINRRDKYEV